MAERYKMTAEQKAEIEQEGQRTGIKRSSTGSRPSPMRADGASARKIGEATGFHPAYVKKE